MGETFACRCRLGCGSSPILRFLQFRDFIKLLALVSYRFISFWTSFVWLHLLLQLRVPPPRPSGPPAQVAGERAQTHLNDKGQSRSQVFPLQLGEAAPENCMNCVPGHALASERSLRVLSRYSPRFSATAASWAFPLRRSRSQFHLQERSAHLRLQQQAVDHQGERGPLRV